jgi:hypothetical protein
MLITGYAMATVQHISEQKNERQNANASAKSKELHPNAKSQTNAAHLLLPQRNDRKTN